MRVEPDLLDRSIHATLRPQSSSSMCAVAAPRTPELVRRTTSSPKVPSPPLEPTASTTAGLASALELFDAATEIAHELTARGERVVEAIAELMDLGAHGGKTCSELRSKGPKLGSEVGETDAEVGETDAEGVDARRLRVDPRSQRVVLRC